MLVSEVCGPVRTLVVFFGDSTFEDNVSTVYLHRVANFRGKKSHFVRLFRECPRKIYDRCSVKLYFFAKFRSVPFRSSVWALNSVTQGIPWKEHFLPRNNENSSESFPRNSF